MENSLIIEQMAKAYLTILEQKKQELEKALQNVEKEFNVCLTAMESLKKPDKQE